MVVSLRETLALPGGGLALYETDTLVTNCTFTDNFANTGAEDGGAINIVFGSPFVKESDFIGNMANAGGAIQANSCSYLTVQGCNFTSNTSDTGGGGIHYNLGNGIIEESYFEANHGEVQGGGVYTYYSAVTINNSVFIENSSQTGGGVAHDFNNGFVQNLENCIFLKNTATIEGGGFHSYERDFSLKNCVFAYNAAPSGGGIRSHGGYRSDFKAWLYNCTLYGNQATTGYGGGIINSSVAMMYLYNTILWSNTAALTIWDPIQGLHVTTPDVFNAGTSSMTTRYCDIQTLSWEHGSISESDTGSFTNNPKFVDVDGDDNIAGTIDDNFRLQSSSPCIDRADGAYAPTVDIVGTSRYDIAEVANLGTGTPNYADVGAYERPATVATPTFSPAGGSGYTNLLNVQISCATTGATIRFTTNGSSPTASSPSGTNVVIIRNMTLKAQGFKTAMLPSDVASTNYSFVDTDGDGLPNWVETSSGVFQSNTNSGSLPGDSDTDNDSVDDGDEVDVYGTDPNDNDTDNDGLTDGQEILTYGTDPKDSDTDNDTMSDGFEVTNGYNPLGGDVRIQGIVSYSGSETGPVLVAVFTNANLEDIVESVELPGGPGAYTITNIYAGTYYVVAALAGGPRYDTDYIRKLHPWGQYRHWTNLAAVVTTTPTQTVTAINFALFDATVDEDNPLANFSGAANDFDGDGRSDIGCYDAAGNLGQPAGSWYLMRTSDGFTTATFGYAGTVPITGDFDGDGKSDYGCYDAAGNLGQPAGSWYLMRSSAGFTTETFGYAGTVPITGDFDGDGVTDYGCYDAAGNLGQPAGSWYLMRSSAGFTTATFGYAGTVPITGDFDGDGKSDYGCYDAAGNYGQPAGSWYLMQTSDGFTTATFGYAGTVPLAGDFDGDGVTDYGCYDAAGNYGQPAGSWYLMRSSAGFTTATFGYAGTVPFGTTTVTE